jgi:ribosomal protein S27AE
MTSISKKACSHCGKPVSLQSAGPMSGTEGAYKLELDHVSVMICGENHKRFVYPDFAIRLMDHIADPDVSGLYAAKTRGFLKKHAHCAKCSVELPTQRPNSKEYRLIVPLPDLQPVTLTLNAPVLMCAQCGEEQLPDASHLVTCVFKAMTHAFRSAEVHAQ